MLLSINVNYLASLRNAIGGVEPDLLKGARFCLHAGAEMINAHIGTSSSCVSATDVANLNKNLKKNFVLKMAMTEENQKFALELRPKIICLVPESDEASPSFGVNVMKNYRTINEFLIPLFYKGVTASIFIEPELDQVTAAYKSGANIVELNTKKYAEAFKIGEYKKEYTQIKECTVLAKTLGMKVTLGKELNYNNTPILTTIPGVDTLSIGHSITTKALFEGFETAIKEMKELINEK